jgi:hypothetical protein
MAVSKRSRGLVIPFLESVIGLPLACIRDIRSAVVSDGYAGSRTAKAPATCGAAIDVPDLETNEPLRPDEVMLVPGANSATRFEEFELLDTVSDLVVLPIA